MLERVQTKFLLIFTVATHTSQQLNYTKPAWFRMHSPYKKYLSFHAEAHFHCRIPAHQIYQAFKTIFRPWKYIYLEASKFQVPSMRRDFENQSFTPAFVTILIYINYVQPMIDNLMEHTMVQTGNDCIMVVWPQHILKMNDSMQPFTRTSKCNCILNHACF